MRRLVLLAFGAIQLVLLARIAMDLGLLPSGGELADVVVSLSDTLATPVQALADAIGIEFPPSTGGVEPLIIAVLVAWSAVEGIVLMIVARSG